MNILVETYVNFSGPANDLAPLVEKISQAVIESGYGVHPEYDALTALIVVRESDILAFENPADFAKTISRNSLAIVIPMEEVKDDSGDKWEASSESRSEG